MPTNHTTTSCQIILGIDIGTSGVRACVVERCQNEDINSSDIQTPIDKIIGSEAVSLEPPKVNSETGASTQNPNLWIKAIEQLFAKLSIQFELKRITHMVLDATSSTVLLTDPDGTALTDALMYNDQQAKRQAEQISATPNLDIDSAATGVSSTLSKVLYLIEQLQQKNELRQTPVICHQIDYINHYLCGGLNITDENNALKLGYDSRLQQWPEWCQSLLRNAMKGFKASGLSLLPKVVSPGCLIGSISTDLVKQYGLSPSLSIHAGTTDSIAGFLASGANQSGDAVSSLGSTLAVKLISDQPIFSAKYGIYSHKLHNQWLVGGASNAGGAVLLKHYQLDELKQLLSAIQSDSGYNTLVAEENRYYPLSTPGERFPIADANLSPQIPEKPSVPVIDPETGIISSLHQQHLIVLLQGLTRIEKMAYDKLTEMGAQKVKQLYCVGGGVQNEVWMKLRKSQFNPETQLQSALSLDAAYGVTKLIDSNLI